MVAPPPGLSLPTFRPPPGLPHPQAGLGKALQSRLDTAAPPCVEWFIKNVYSKLKVSSGFALVSPPLQIGDISDVRLHFAPGEGWAAGAPGRKNKKLAVKAEGGKAKCTVSLKLGDLGCDKILKFYLFVGDLCRGPFECSFVDKVVQELEFDLDWRRHLEAGSENLRLRLQLLE